MSRRQQRTHVKVKAPAPTFQKQQPVGSVHPVISWGPAKEQKKKVAESLEIHGGGIPGFRPCDIPNVPKAKAKGSWILIVIYPSFCNESAAIRSINVAWQSIKMPEGHGKSIERDLKISSKYIELIDGTFCKPGIYWVDYNPYSHEQVSVGDVWVSFKKGLDYIITLWALVHKPNWALMWKNATFGLSALRVKIGIETYSAYLVFCKATSKLKMCFCGQLTSQHFKRYHPVFGM